MSRFVTAAALRFYRHLGAAVRIDYRYLLFDKLGAEFLGLLPTDCQQIRTGNILCPVMVLNPSPLRHTGVAVQNEGLLPCLSEKQGCAGTSRSRSDYDYLSHKYTHFPYISCRLPAG
ncbi:hypothetical protein D1872_300690 [compost metagenome]